MEWESKVFELLVSSLVSVTLMRLCRQIAFHRLILAHFKSSCGVEQGHRDDPRFTRRTFVTKISASKEGVHDTMCLWKDDQTFPPKS